jgi:hypothetical protein
MDQPVALHLRIRIQNRSKLIDFLRRALKFYEKDGIKIRLLQDWEDPNTFLEIVEYRDRPSYEEDQHRVESDPEMKVYLQNWHELLASPLIVETYYDVTQELHQQEDING